MTPFSYKGQRKINTKEGEVIINTIEGFLMEEVVDWAIAEFTEGEGEELVVRLKNIEDKDVVRQFPILGAKGVVKGVENKLVHRMENSSVVISDKEAIEKWKSIMIR